MEREMITINVNLVKEVEFSEFEKGDFIHVFGYFKEHKRTIRFISSL